MRISREAPDVPWRVLGGEHPNRLAPANNLASVLQEIGEFSEAVRISRETPEAP